jgi:hypothetical protein
MDTPRFSIDDLMERTEEIIVIGKSLDDYIKENVIYRTGVKETFDSVNDRLGKLEEKIVLGNGERSLIEQVHTIQKECLARGEKKKEVVGARWAFYTAVVTAVIGTVSAVAIALANSGSSNTDEDRIQAEEVRQILQIVREEENLFLHVPAHTPGTTPVVTYSSLP